MNRSRPHPSDGGFTLIELLLVIGIIGILAALLLPSLAKAKLQAKRAYCVNNLQQTVIGFHSFAHDHNSRFPMQVAPEDGGTMMPVAENEPYLLAPAFRHFQALSNELRTPKILICPADGRSEAARFAGLQSENVSYFVVANAQYGHALSVLAGDRNLTNILASTAPSGALPSFRWTSELHQFKGNLLFADGHIEKHNNTSIAGMAAGSLAEAVVQLPRPGVNPGPPDFAPPPPPPAPEIAMQSPEPGSPASHAPVAPAGEPSARIYVPTPFGHFAVSRAVLADAGTTVKSNPPVTGSPVTVAVVVHDAEQEESAPGFDLAGILGLKKIIKNSYLLLLLLLLLLLTYAIWREWRKRKARQAEFKPVTEEL